MESLTIPLINGKSIYDQYHDNINNLDFLLRGCKAIELKELAFKPNASIVISVFNPRPAYFLRAMIVANKLNDHELVVKVGERWLRLEERYLERIERLKGTNEYDFHQDISKDASSRDIKLRIDKALSKLEKIKSKNKPS